MRIEKAIQYGASWIKNWSDGITHVVTDSNASYQDLLTFLIRSSLPENIIVVNERYPADCISFRSLLEPTLVNYRVHGAPEAAPKPSKDDRASLSVAETVEKLHAAAESNLSEVSLPLKPAGRDVMAREPQTPSRSDESSYHHSHTRAGETAEKGFDIASGNAGDSSYRDALTEAIEQAKTLQHVVCG